jgi:hypothetical protein
VRGDPKHPANFGRLCTKGLDAASYRRLGLARPVSGVAALARSSACAGELGRRA